LVKEFEQEVASLIGVKHCMAVCNATVGLEIAIRALEFSGEVIVPSYTFVATAHALRWLGIRPVFADIDPRTHNLDPDSVARKIGPWTTGIIGVHLWGHPCETDALENIASRHGLKIMYDAAHAFGSSKNGVMVGNFGACEVFSFHATKFLNSFEGGAIVTNDDALAAKIRLMRNFGFSGFDNVVSLGINGKMNEVCAAMGLTSLESARELMELNSKNFESYRAELDGIPGISLMERGDGEHHNFQYIVLELEETRFGMMRDELVQLLHSHNVIARRYFWPACHRMEPYCSDNPPPSGLLPVTEQIAARVIVLPTGQAVDLEKIQWICRIIKDASCDSAHGA
jgi:dTDP-4-amino-4,6-dideoxygalactose transaminase